MRKGSGLVALLGLSVIVLPGCGGDNAAAPTPVATPPPPPVTRTTVILQTSQGGLPPISDAGQALSFLFTTNAVGTIDATVDWTFEASDINISLFQGTLEEIAADCTGQACAREVARGFTLNKPETLTFAAAPAGPYLVQIVNLGSMVESISIEILLTTTSSATSSHRTPEHAAEAAITRPALGVF